MELFKKKKKSLQTRSLVLPSGVRNPFLYELIFEGEQGYLGRNGSKGPLQTAAASFYCTSHSCQAPTTNVAVY